MIILINLLRIKANVLIMKGLTIKEILRKNGYTVTGVAEKLGESNQNLFALLGKDDVRSSLIERISEATGLPIAAFYGEAYSSSATASGNSVAVSGDGNSVNSISERFISLLEKKDEQMDRLIGMLESKVGTTNETPNKQ